MPINLRLESYVFAHNSDVSINVSYLFSDQGTGIRKIHRVSKISQRQQKISVDCRERETEPRLSSIKGSDVPMNVFGWKVRRGEQNGRTVDSNFSIKHRLKSSNV